MRPLRATACLGVTAMLLGSCELERGGIIAEPDTGGSAGVGGIGANAGSGGSVLGGSSGLGGMSGSSGGSFPDAAAGSGGFAGNAPDASVWKPTDFQGCVLWLDAADPSVFSLSGSAVTMWQDKCGGNSASGQSGPAPQLITGSSSLPAVRCDGTDDRLVLAGPAIDAADYSLFFVLTKTLATTQQHPIWSNYDNPPTPGGTNTWLGFYGGRLYVFQGASGPPSLLGNNVHLAPVTGLFELTVTASGARELRWNGQLEVSNTATKTSGPLGVGAICAHLSKQEFGAYDLHEIVAYASALGETERGTVRAELSAKWGIGSADGGP